MFTKVFVYSFPSSKLESVTIVYKWDHWSSFEFSLSSKSKSLFVSVLSRKLLQVFNSSTFSMHIFFKSNSSCSRLELSACAVWINIPSKK